jgi:hypothetical protein
MKLGVIDIENMVAVSSGGITVITKRDPGSDRIEVQVWEAAHNILLSSEIYHDPLQEPRIAA